MKTIRIRSAENYEDKETSRFSSHSIDKSLVIVIAVPSFYKLLLGAEPVPLLVDQEYTDP